MLHLETRLGDVEACARQNARRLDDLESSMRDIAESLVAHGQLLDGLQHRNAKLSDMATVTQLKLERVEKNTAKILVLVEKAHTP